MPALSSRANTNASERLRHLPAPRFDRERSTPSASPCQRAEPWEVTSRHQVQHPVPVAAPVYVTEDDMSPTYLEAPMSPGFMPARQEQGCSADGTHVDDWLEFELKARLARIDASVSKVPHLANKLDEVLCLLRSGDCCSIWNDMAEADMQRPSFKSPNGLADGRPSFNRKSGLFGGSKASARLPKIAPPPPPAVDAKTISPRIVDLPTNGTDAAMHLAAALSTVKAAADVDERQGSKVSTGRLTHGRLTGKVSLQVVEDTGGTHSDDLNGQAASAVCKEDHESEEPMSPVSVTSHKTFGETATAAMHDSFQRRNSNLMMIGMANFFEDSESGFFAMIYARSMLPFLLSTVCISLLQGVDDPLIDGTPAAVINTVIESIFLVDLAVRLIVTRSKRLFFLDVYNLIDMISVAPLALRVAMGFEVYTSTGACTPLCALLLGVVPVLRLLKLLRRFQNFHLLLKAFSLALEALPVLLFIWGVLCLVSAAALFVIEPRDNIPTLTVSLWCAAVSMTTLGYGDVYPVTNSGRVVVVALVITSILYTAIPLGIIGSAFSEVWSDRDRILLTQRTRKRLMQAGYEARDIPYLFKIFDRDQDDALDVEEFRTMVGFMKVGLTSQRVGELFDMFDADGGGTIDSREFVRALYPESYHDIYGAVTSAARQEITCECGNQLMPDANFCRRCGRPRSEDDVEKEPPAEKALSDL